MIVAVVICNDCGARKLGRVERRDDALWWCAREPSITALDGAVVGDTADAVEAALQAQGRARSEDAPGGAPARGRSTTPPPPVELRRPDQSFYVRCRQHPRARRDERTSSADGAWIRVREILDALATSEKGSGPVTIRVALRSPL